MTHPEIALETTAEWRFDLRMGLTRGATEQGPLQVRLREDVALRLLNDIDTLLARVADAEEHLSAVIRSEEWAHEKLGKLANAERELAVLHDIETWICNPASSYSTSALDGLFGMTRDRLAAIRSLIPDPETKEDDNG